jgi:hypothetical protein
LLLKWYKAVVKEYNITSDMVLSGVGDSGSDVKKVMKESVSGYGLHEWCLSHLLNRAFIASFGVTVGKTNSKHPECREAIFLMRKMVKSLNKSTLLRKNFEDYQYQRSKTTTKVRNAPQHRWDSMEETLSSILRLWVDLERAHRATDKLAAWDKIVPHKELYEELYSILKPFRVVQVLAQSGLKFNTPDVLIKFFMAYKKICRGINNTVTMLWPPPDLGRAAPPIPEKTNDDLHSISRSVIQKMRSALDKRYFYRYHPLNSLRDKDQWSSLTTTTTVDLSYFKSAYVFEMLLLLHPELYKGAFVRENCNLIDIFETGLKRMRYPNLPGTPELRNQHAELLLAALWRKIRQLAMEAGRATPSVARQLDLNSQSPVDSNHQTPPRKCPRHSLMSELGYASSESASEAETTSPVAPPMSIAEQVDMEIRRWRSLGDNWKHHKQDRRLPKDGSSTAIDWWVKWGETEDFPCLTKVALALFSLLPGSGALEWDIGCFKDIVQPKRASLGPGVVEMNVVVGLNRSLHELDTTKVAPLRENWAECIPTRPSSPVGYHDGEEDYIPYELDNNGSGIVGAVVDVL